MSLAFATGKIMLFRAGVNGEKWEIDAIFRLE
jgi:hypothetical protein